MKLVVQASIQDAVKVDGREAHAASMNVQECRSVIVLDQLGRGSCTSDLAVRVHASARDYRDTLEHGEP